jgi:hypothetical protein
MASAARSRGPDGALKLSLWRRTAQQIPIPELQRNDFASTAAKFTT